MEVAEPGGEKDKKVALLECGYWKKLWRKTDLGEHVQFCKNFGRYWRRNDR